MPKIQIQWDSGMDDDFEASMQALDAYRPSPEIKVNTRLKGVMPPDAIKEIVRLAELHQVEVQVTLTAAWEADQSPFQFRLFSPPEHDAVPRSIFDDPDILKRVN